MFLMSEIPLYTLLAPCGLRCSHRDLAGGSQAQNLTPSHHNLPSKSLSGKVLQLYLAYKKTQPPRIPQQDHAHGPMGVVEEWAFSYERGTPVQRWRESFLCSESAPLGHQGPSGRIPP